MAGGYSVDPLVVGRVIGDVVDMFVPAKGPLGLVDQPPCRANFNTRFFAAHLDLGLPVATVYFNSQKEPATKRR
uniref:Uncharacterized protein n=1 Tax=Cannabis sativa TaxID=3483 RepID=A0A803P7J5_CANSA